MKKLLTILTLIAVSGTVAAATTTNTTQGTSIIETRVNSALSPITTREKEINAVTVAKLMDGYNNGLFWPDKSITREEVAKVIYFLVNDVSAHKEVNYLDVSKNRWSYQYIQKLSSLGIFNGYENGKFQPQSPIKRSEMVTVLDRIFSND